MNRCVVPVLQLGVPSNKLQATPSSYAFICILAPPKQRTPTCIRMRFWFVSGPASPATNDNQPPNPDKNTKRMTAVQPMAAPPYRDFLEALAHTRCHMASLKNVEEMREMVSVKMAM